VLVFAFFTLLGLAKTSTNFVIAVVSGEAITHRYMEIESVLETPSVFKEGYSLNLENTSSQRLLQQLVIRSMVMDENRVLKIYQVPKVDVDQKYAQFQKAIGGSRLKEFIQHYSLSEADIRNRLESWIVLEKTLSDQEDVETWLKRLRARHEVTLFKR